MEFTQVFGDMEIELKPGEIGTPGQIAVQYFINDISSRKLELNDGINLGNQDNLFPYERDLEIKRNLPPNITVEDIPEEANPLMKLVLTQQNNAAKSIVPVKGNSKVGKKPTASSPTPSSPPAALPKATRKRTTKAPLPKKEEK
jgi:acetylornithine deacetylase/succinyl-diaminopimelate desuccinylase-like protein